MPAPEPRRGSPDPTLDEAEFRRRFFAQFQDPAFAAVKAELDRVADVAWDGYNDYRKAPVTRKAGQGYADADYDLGVDWIAAREAIGRAQQRHQDPESPARILLINGSARNEHTCPGEVSKSWRLLQIAREVLAAPGNIELEVLDLSRLASEYGRRIHPCKACFSTAAPLCHWPCSCYPNHAMGQTQDWMNDIYPMWVAAHGILIVTPVNWYHTSAPLKLMCDRLVCADGGNPDPTRTGGKDAVRAKALELAGWDYPRHLAGRVFSVIVHGDAEGVSGVRRNVSDWLRSMHLLPAGPGAELERYIDYLGPYATSHDALDADEDLHEEVRNVARTLLEAVRARRAGTLVVPGAGLHEPRRK